MEQKLEKLNKIIQEVKFKMEKIQNLNINLKCFNYKIEAFLKSFEALSCIKIEDLKNKEENSFFLNESFNDSLNLDTKVEFNNTIEVTKCETNKSLNVVKEQETCETILSRVLSALPDNKIYRNYGEKIIKCLYNQECGMLLEDIIKHSGVTRYKCVDVLNILMKTEPQIIFKKFDKGFNYILNKKY